MQDLHTTYLGLKLKNPIIVGSGPLTANLDNLKRCEDSGVGAVVLKSIFEEQIEKEAESVVDENEEYLTHSDAAAFVRGNITEQAVDTYLTLVSNAKKSLSIPVIASINCKSAGRWTEYANRFAKAGADAIEINHYVVAADRNIDGLTVEKEFVNLVHNARKSIKLPLAVKMGMFYSSMRRLTALRESPRLASRKSAPRLVSADNFERTELPEKENGWLYRRCAFKRESCQSRLPTISMFDRRDGAFRQGRFAIGDRKAADDVRRILESIGNTAEECIPVQIVEFVRVERS